jgi:hypothetical protein
MGLRYRLIGTVPSPAAIPKPLMPYRGQKVRRAMMQVKKVSGIKQNIEVDTQGLPHATWVTTADVTDRVAALEMLDRQKSALARVTTILAGCFQLRAARSSLLVRTSDTNFLGLVLSTFF